MPLTCPRDVAIVVVVVEHFMDVERKAVVSDAVVFAGEKRLVYFRWSVGLRRVGRVRFRGAK